MKHFTKALSVYIFVRLKMLLDAVSKSRNFEYNRTLHYFSGIYQIQGKSVEVLWTEFKEALNSGIQKFIPTKFIGNKHIFHGSLNQLKEKLENVTTFIENLLSQKTVRTEKPS